MSLFNLFFFFLILLTTFVYGQKGFEKGYIISNNKDTLVGYVKDRKPPPFEKLYKKVVFKKKHKKRKFGPDKINGYKKGATVYESMWVDVSGHLINEKYTSIPNHGEKEFLKVVVKGYLTNYQREFTDADSNYINHVSLFKKADEDSFIRVTQGIFGLRKKSLKLYFKDCSELIKKIENGQLRTSKEIAVFYNAWHLKNQFD